MKDLRIQKACPEDKVSARELSRAEPADPVLILYQTRTWAVPQRGLIAYEQKWKFVIVMIDCSIAGIWMGLTAP